MNPYAELLDATCALADLIEAAGRYTYEEHNVKRWLTDADPCEVCEDNADLGWIDDDDVFVGVFGFIDDGEAHPNAVLRDSTFAPYGSLERMVSGEYNGPAITLNAGEHRTTIGANHPMLTARGLVAAQFLHIGDQLVYDERPLGLDMAEANLDQVETVKDYFASLRARFGHSIVAASSHDFHGDPVLNNKIDVVFPDGKLLNKLDPCGMQRLREMFLVGTDVQFAGKANGRLFREQFNRLFLPAPGGVGRCNVSHDVCLLTIEDIRIDHYRGEAFDATTSAGLYRSDGFVVSNCKCTVEYAVKRRRVYA